MKINNNKTFILVIGAQKAGTSWLYRALNERKDTNFGVTKEYHIWDALDMESCSRFDLTQRSYAVNYAKFLGRLSFRKIYHVTRMQKNNSYYFEYFKKILDTVNITGDFTPSYAGLNAKRINWINDQFLKLDIQLKVVFLLRDPFERALSAYKMHIRNKRSEEINLRANFDDGFIEYIRSDNCKIRTKYEKTLNMLGNLDASISYHVDGYESLFFDKNLTSLESFLDLQIPRVLLKKTYNTASKKQKQSVTTEVREKFIDLYNQTYRTCFLNYPQLTSHWKGK